MKLILRFLLALMVVSFAPCSHPISAASITKTLSLSSGYKLPSPGDCEALPSEDTVSFLLTHYWDNFDFADTLRSHNQEVMEQNFADYAFFLVAATDTVLRRNSVRELMKKAETDKKVYNLLASIASRYLYDPNSPMLDEEAYIPFLEIFVESPLLSEAQRGRSLFLLQTAMKNRPGTYAADFSYVTREGERTSLYSTPVKGNLLLIFYDPDCDSCREIMSAIAADEKIGSEIEEGDLTVLAIYSGDEEELWHDTYNLLPGKWIVGFDNGAIDEADSYYFRSSPTLYLLDADKKVLLKDFPPSDLF